MNDTIYIGAGVLMTLAIWAAIACRRSFDVPEGHYGLLYLHGKSLHRISPGRHWFWKHGYTVHLVDMRKAVLEVTNQDVLTADQVGLRVSAVMTYQIVQAETVTHDVQDYMVYLRHAMQLAIRSVISATGAEKLQQREADINRKLLAQLGPAADEIGIMIHSFELEELKLAGEPKMLVVAAS